MAPAGLALSSFLFIGKPLGYIPNTNHQGLFPYLATSSSEADHQGPAIKVLKSSNQKSPLAHLINMPN